MKTIKIILLVGAVLGVLWITREPQTEAQTQCFTTWDGAHTCAEVQVLK